MVHSTIINPDKDMAIFTAQTGPANPLDGVNVGLDSSPTFVDIDEDGDFDAFIGESDGNINYYQNNSGTFTEITGPANPLDGVDVGAYSKPTFVDIDGDGDFDAFIGESDGNINYYQNNSGTFTEITGPANPLSGVNIGFYSTFTFVDIDGDGDFDAFIGAYYGNINYYQNTTPLALIAPGTTPTEAGTTSSFTVTLDQAQAAELTVNYTAGGTATADTDYTALTGTATVTAGNTSATIDVVPIDDNIDDDAETVIVTLDPGTDYGVDRNNNSATVTITDNDTAADNTAADELFPVPPGQGTPFISPSNIKESIDSSTDTSTATASNSSTDLPEPPPYPAEPTVDLVNISFTAIGTDGAENIDSQSTDDTISALAGDDVIRGLQGNDRLFGNEGNDQIFGNQGADLLLGNIGNDIIYSGQDNDIIYSGQGNDLAYGDLGSDTLLGELDDDRLFGGSSNPDLVSGDAGDLLFGGDGNDYLNGNVGNDSISGGTGNDTAYGGQSNDLIHGDAGADLLYGDKGNDSLTGNADNDLVFGGDGQDYLWGGDGDDRLYGEAGNDTLIGNAGSDYFAIATGFGSDQVLDFIDGTDLIGLAGGLTFADLSITGSNGNTLISIGNELLATLTGVDVSLIDNQDFTVLV